MGYAVNVSGRIRITVEAEQAAIGALKHELWRGEEIDGAVSSLADLVWEAVVTREGDWLRFVPDHDGDPNWSYKSNIIYGSLGTWAGEGRILVEGEDGEQWAYIYDHGGSTQEGTNGWDSSTVASPLPRKVFEGPSRAEQTPASEKHSAEAMNRRGDVVAAFRDFGKDSREFRSALEASDQAEIRLLRQLDAGGARVALFSPEPADAAELCNNLGAVGVFGGNKVNWPAEEDALGLRYVVFRPEDTPHAVEGAIHPLSSGVGSLFWESVEHRDDLVAQLRETVAVVIAMTMEDTFSEMQLRRIEDLRGQLRAHLTEHRRWEWIDRKGVRRTLP